MKAMRPLNKKRNGAPPKATPKLSTKAKEKPKPTHAERAPTLERTAAPMPGGLRGLPIVAANHHRCVLAVAASRAPALAVSPDSR